MTVAWSELLGVGIVPVVALEDANTALPLADALSTGGIKVIEVTLRTAAALDAVSEIRQHRPDFVVGVGTITTPEHLEQAQQRGAHFGVSPGLTPRLAQAAADSGWPLLPGVATASELMAAMEWGFSTVKFFPAEAAGGISMLKSLAGPFSDARFCPTGGIDRDSAPYYFQLPNVVAVGGSWMAPSKLINDAQWEEIAHRSQKAVEAIG